MNRTSTSEKTFEKSPEDEGTGFSNSGLCLFEEGGSVVEDNFLSSDSSDMRVCFVTCFHIFGD